MNIFGYEISIWRILYILVLMCITAWHIFMPSTVEAFTSGEEFNQLIGCPGIRNTINTHKKLVEGYTEKEAVVSAGYAQEVLDLFTASYNKYGCETYLKNMPAEKPKEAEKAAKEE